MDDHSGAIGIVYRGEDFWRWAGDAGTDRAITICADINVGKITKVRTGGIHRAVLARGRVQVPASRGEPRCLAFADEMKMNAVLPRRKARHLRIEHEAGV